MRTRSSAGLASVLIVALAVAVAAAGCSSQSTATTSANGVTTTSPGSSVPGGSSGTTAPAPGSTVAGASTKPATGAARPSKGCRAGTPIEGAGTAQHSTMAVAGTEHPVRIFVPTALAANPTKPVPLVFDLHGLTEPADVQASVSKWETKAETEGIVVLTPQGGGKIPSWAATLNDNPDYDFLQQLLDKTEDELCIDTSRVYSGGISNGGLMSSILGCKMADRVAAVGLVSGIVVPDECTTARAMPAVVFWGKKDCVLPYYGGLGPCLMKSAPPVPTEPQVDAKPPPVETNVASWAKRNGCAGTPTVTQVGSDVERRVFGGCKDGNAVELYVVSDGGHTWPGSEAAKVFGDPRNDPSEGITTAEISATDLMWEFFQRYQVPA